MASKMTKASHIIYKLLYTYTDKKDLHKTKIPCTYLHMHAKIHRQYQLYTGKWQSSYIYFNNAKYSLNMWHASQWQNITGRNYECW